MKSFALSIVLTLAVSSTPIAAASDRQSSIGYASVDAARAALKNDPNAEVREQDGWTIIQTREGEKSMSIWSFSPPSHPAYPAVVKRTIYEEDGSVMMKTNALCQASKSECDKLMAQFAEMERQMRERMQSGDNGT
jgi:hypothetical protein